MTIKKTLAPRFWPLCACLFLAKLAGAITCTPTYQGNWSNPAAWQGGVVPTAADDVFLQGGCNLTLDVMTGAVRELTIGSASLTFSTATSTRLTTDGGIDIGSGGVLTMGTEANPIPAGSSATLVLGSGDRLIIFTGGTFSGRGASKSPAAQAVNNAMAGATSLQVPDAQAAGWKAGDTITIGQTKTGAWVNETEERVIASTSSAGGFTTVTWAGGLAYDHAAADVIRVLNLTRNVLVRSAGTNPGVDTSSFELWFDYQGNFSPAHVEFAHLTVFFRPTSDISVSSCSFHHGTGITSENWGGIVTFSNNAVYKQLATGFTPSVGAIITGSDFAANGSNGLLNTHAFPGDTVIRGNFFYSNAGNGALLKGENNVVADNRFVANQGAGATLEGDRNYFAGNVFKDNHTGFVFSGDRNVIVNNLIRENESTGLQSGGAANTGSEAVIVGNESLVNGNQGFHMAFPGSLLLKNTVHANGTWGMTVSTSITLVETVVGYNTAGIASPNAGGFPEIAANPGQLTMRACRIHPANGLEADAVLSYNQNFATGTVKVTGDYVLPAGASLALDNAELSWRSTATAPVLLHGADHTASVLSTSDAGAVSQYVTVRCVNAAANQWVVEGSASGTLFGPFTGGITNQDIGGQFNLTFTPDPFGGQRTDDRVGFVLMAASTDAGIRKQVLFQDDASLTAAPGAAFSLKGAPGTPALMDLDAGATDPFTFVSSGAFTLENAAVRRMAPAGFQLSGSGGVAMSSVTFDTVGAAGGAYVTARNLTSNAVLTNIAFDPGTIDANVPFSARVLGTDAGLQWTFVDYSGNRTGNASDSDPNNRIYWAGSTPVGAPASFSAAVLGDGLRLTWAAPPLPHAHFRGEYLLSYSSVSAAGPFTSLTPPTAGATSRDHLSLLPETTYYYRLTATDLRGNTGAAAATSGRTGDFSQPEILSIQSMEARTAGVGWSSPLTVAFNKSMSVPAVTGALSLRRLKDRLGNILTPPETLTAQAAPDVSGTVYAVTSTAPFMSNSTYELTVSTAAADPLGQSIPSSSVLRFTTLMDRTVRNVVTEGTLGAVVDVPAGALSVNGYITGAAAPPAAAAAATQKLIANTGDALRAPVSGSMTALEAFDAAGAPLVFAAPVIVTFNYPDATGDGVVDGTSPPVKAKTLRVHWLDERTNTWQRLPSSAVDATGRQVSARAPHFTAFALIGAASTELTDAHAFPNPWTPESGAPVTFSGLGDITTIRIFTPQGSLIKEWTVSDGSGQSTWDARGDDGAPAASGLYVYKITSGGNVVTGKLVVVR